jgi:glycosyltransferase involved in cell wall biosynthesis
VIVILEKIANLIGDFYGRVHRPYSRLFFKRDYAGWVLDWEARQLADIAGKLGIHVGDSRLSGGVTDQCVFYTNQFAVFSNPSVMERGNRLAFAYFHGQRFDLDTAFEGVFAALCRYHEKLDRIQVSNTVFREFVIKSGISPHKVFVIPIGIDLTMFQQQTPETRKYYRARYGIPQSAVAVGSFQKDGIGWEDGVAPKLIKGPDTFLSAIDCLRKRVPELFVVLSGPARGYVRAGMERMKVPYVHHNLASYTEIDRLYKTLDAYIVSSREEGGPKAVLESMASGVPLITTRVGQAVDLVKHEMNGWMVEPEDSKGLAQYTEKALSDSASRAAVIRNGRMTAEQNSYEAQLPKWRHFMHGFVDFPE